MNIMAMSIEPEVDEEAFQRVQRLIKVSALKGSPMEGDSCGNCLYYLDHSDDLSFCWHEKFQTLVGKDWWCHWWEMLDQ